LRPDRGSTKSSRPAFRVSLHKASELEAN
jgi:hypothetical protein